MFSSILSILWTDLQGRHESIILTSMQYAGQGSIHKLQDLGEDKLIEHGPKCTKNSLKEGFHPSLCFFNVVWGSYNITRKKSSRDRGNIVQAIYNISRA